MKKKGESDRIRLPEGVSIEDALRAMLHTPPPPAGDPSTRKQKPTKKPARKKKG